MSRRHWPSPPLALVVAEPRPLGAKEFPLAGFALVAFPGVGFFAAVSLQGRPPAASERRGDVRDDCRQARHRREHGRSWSGGVRCPWIVSGRDGVSDSVRHPLITTRGGLRYVPLVTSGSSRERKDAYDH